nr:MAG TPA: CbiX [Caudoviricetes sp.]
MHAQYLEVVKTQIQTSPEFINCRVETYIEPSISSAIFYIYADGYKHIFKAPFGLLESKLTATALAEIIIDEVKEWRDKLNAV